MDEQEKNVTEPIQIDRDGLCLNIPSADLERLGGGFFVPILRPTEDVDHGYDVNEHLEPLISQQRRANYGMLQVVMHLARKNGLTCDAWFRQRIRQIDELPPGQYQFPEVLKFIHNQKMGIIRVSVRVEVADMIADIIRFFREDRIIVVGKGRALRSAYNGVCRAFAGTYFAQEDLVFVNDRNPFDPDREYPRVAFSTPLQAADLGSEHCSIAILLDAFDCLHERVEDFLCQVDARFRLFGIHRVDRQPTPYEQARLYRAYGFEQVEFESHGRVRREVTHTYRSIGGMCPRGAIVRRRSTTPGRRGGRIDAMKAYVRHDRRNRKICRFARTLLNEGEAVVVLVDLLDHAIQLGRKLPGWPIVARPESCLSRIDQRMRDRINPAEATCSAGTGVIVVADAADNFPGFNSTAIVWAGGGRSVPVPRSWMFERTRRQYPLAILDFLDYFSPETRRASRIRRESLETMGIFKWSPSESTPRIERFVESLIRSSDAREVAE